MVLKGIQLQDIKKQIIANLVADLNAKKIVLYGSYASGKPSDKSDMDLAVISPVFRGRDYINRLNLIDKSLDKIKKPFLNICLLIRSGLGTRLSRI